MQSYKSMRMQHGASHLDGHSCLQEEIAKIFLGNSYQSDQNTSLFPFMLGDVTAGTETELQAAVIGKKDCVDLPLIIEASNYYANIVKRAASGDTSKKLITDLEKYLDSNSDGVWENSFVRLRCSVLTPFAESVFRHDVLADKEDRSKGNRSDVDKYIYNKDGVEYIRVPVSYLLKLALADLTGSDKGCPRMLRRTGYTLMDCFTNDNTSPETHSFHVIAAGCEEGIGKAVAKETSRRFLLSQLLILYANEKFRLKSNGQEACLYFSPHPPVRQRKLNECISDAFYRELFMNPCLSGWNEGEPKHRYMHLCHEVLSRSQLNAVVKLKEAGILHNGLALLPNTSNIGLSNNGLHLSLGSERLKMLLEDGSSGFTPFHEKYAADLVVKIVEHFLPLFVGAYTASPYRIDFWDFHPEKVLGFLPHELDFTHLRMLWRRWKKKAQINVLGHSITPFGPLGLDKLCRSIFDLRGDFIPDYRLINYLVCLMSTEQNPALNGVLGNTTALKKDLSDMGIFHNDMSVYLLYKPREYRAMGFSGFEGRHYSLFESFQDDLGNAAAMQHLITALAYKYIIEGTVSHQHIPDTPFVESERRQIIFDASVGIPTFFIRTDSDNMFLKSIIERTPRIRSSKRYPGYIRIKLADYMIALLDKIREDAAGLIEMFGMSHTIDDLAERLKNSGNGSASSKLTRGILEDAGLESPFGKNGDDFNIASEKYYREALRKKHLTEALCFFGEDLKELDKKAFGTGESVLEALRFVLGDKSAHSFSSEMSRSLSDGSATEEDIKKCVYLILIVEHNEQVFEKKRKNNYDTTPIYRSGNS